MEKSKFYYILLLIIFIFVISNITPVLASEDTLVNTASKVKEDFGPGDRNFFNEITDKAQEQIEKLMNKTQDKAKQTIKEKSKNFIRNRIEWTKELLSPLKIKIQQGSDIIREEVNKLKNYLKDLF